LEGNHDSDDEEQRPTEIKPWQVKKKKGEFEKAAIQREVDKYVVKKPAATKKKEDDDDEDEDNDEEEAEEEAVAVTKEEVKKKKKAIEKKEEKEEEQEPEEEKAADLMIQPDLDAAKDKYKHRRKLPKVDLPRSELEEEKKEVKSVPQTKKGKKKAYVDEEAEYDKKKTLAYADWD